MVYTYLEDLHSCRPGSTNSPVQSFLNQVTRVKFISSNAVSWIFNPKGAIFLFWVTILFKYHELTSLNDGLPGRRGDCLSRDTVVPPRHTRNQLPRKFFFSVQLFPLFSLTMCLHVSGLFFLSISDSYIIRSYHLKWVKIFWMNEIIYCYTVKLYN